MTNLPQSMIEAGAVEIAYCRGTENLHDVVTRIYLAMRPHDPAGQWQPIETAPKDGAFVLLWDGYAYYLCQWDEEEAEWIDGGRFHSGNAATHWQPLPTHPPQLREPSDD